MSNIFDIVTTKRYYSDVNLMNSRRGPLNRRNFLKGAGLFAVGMATGKGISDFQAEREEKIEEINRLQNLRDKFKGMTLGVLGGGRGSFDLDALEGNPEKGESPLARPVVIGDPNPDVTLHFNAGRCNSSHKKEPLHVVRHFRTVTEDPNIQAVIIATPYHSHNQIALHAIRNGKHIYLEKPIATNIPEVRSLVKATLEHPELAVQIGTQRRDNPAVKQAIAEIAGGKIGEVKEVELVANVLNNLEGFLHSESEDRPYEFEWDEWQYPAEGRMWHSGIPQHWCAFPEYAFGGNISNWGSHMIGTGMDMLGIKDEVPHTVNCTSAEFPYKEHKKLADYGAKNPTMTRIEYRYSNGRKIVFREQNENNSYSVTAHGEAGSLRVQDYKRLELLNRDGKKAKELSKIYDDVYVTRLHMRNWFACMETGGMPSSHPTKEAPVAVAHILATASAMLGRPIHWEGDAMSGVPMLKTGDSSEPAIDKEALDIINSGGEQERTVPGPEEIAKTG